MEALGITLSILPIFGVCLEYFEYFKTAQSLSADCRMLLLKLDFEHERFIIWGEKYGIGNKTKGTQDPEPDDLPIDKFQLAKAALGVLEALFKDSKTLSDKYGVKQLDPEKSDNDNGQAESKEKFISTAALKRFRRKAKTQNIQADVTTMGGRHSLVARTRWAVYDKSKFEVLVKDIRELVTSLYEIFPIPNKERDKMVLDDMRSLLPDIGRLQQVEVASEDLYTTWSEGASMIVLASEMGSLASVSLPNGTNIHEFVEESSRTAAPSAQLMELNTELLSRSYTNIFVVFTSECLSISTTTPCRPKFVGETCVLKADFPSFTPEGPQVFWSLGTQITKTINPSLPSGARDILETVTLECDEFQKLAIEAMLPVHDVKIYCSPCACAIRTALKICEEKTSALIKYTVRVDERLPSSCCSYSTVMDTISSLLQTIQLGESDQLGRLKDIIHYKMLKYLDKQWIEKMLYRLECKPPQFRHKTDLVRRVGQLVSETAATEYCAVFIGEIDYFRPVIEMSAFPKLPRPPRVNEIYKMGKESAAFPWEIKFLGTFTPKNFKALRVMDLRNITSEEHTIGAHGGPKSSARTERTDLNVL